MPYLRFRRVFIKFKYFDHKFAKNVNLTCFQQGRGFCIQFLCNCFEIDLSWIGVSNSGCLDSHKMIIYHIDYIYIDYIYIDYIYIDYIYNHEQRGIQILNYRWKFGSWSIIKMKRCIEPIFLMTFYYKLKTQSKFMYFDE